MSSTTASVPSHQQGWILSAVKSPLELKTDLPVPTPSADHLLVRIHASSLNPIDYKVAKFGNFFGLPLPASIGWDYSGEVVAIGSDVKDFKVGDEVFGVIPLFESGSYVQYASVPVSGAAKKPASVSHIEAATLGVAALSAYSNLKLVDLKDKTVFVAGGSGGVGHFAVTFARLLGAKHVLTSASKEESIEWLKNVAKVDAVFNYKKENVVEAVKKFTGGRGADVAYDSTYLKESVLESISLLAEGGVLNVLDTGKPPEDVEKLINEKKGKAIYHDLGRYNSYLKEQFSRNAPLLAEEVKFLEEGKVKILISDVLKFEQIPEGLERLESGKFKGGKLVVKHI